MRRIYLDFQAATPVAPEVWAAMEPWFAVSFGNPSSPHQGGLAARQAVERAREEVAAFVHARSPEQIVFTGSGTEAVNLAVKGTAWTARRRGEHLVVSGIEHPAVLHSVEFLEQQGFTCTRVPVDREGWVAPSAVRAALTDRTILVCVHHANHEIGTIEPIAEIGAIAAEAGVPLFVDAVASAGWLDIDVRALNASLLAFSPHRFGGPKGVGVLYCDRAGRLTPLVHGGGQEGGRHAGTENVPAIVGAGVACALAGRDRVARAAAARELQDRLWNGIRTAVPDAHRNGAEPGPGRLPNNLNVSFAGVEGQGVLLNLDLQGLAIAAGAACQGRSVRIPPVLAALGLDPALARGNILLSLGPGNTAEEIDHAVGVLARTIARLREMSPSWDRSISPPAQHPANELTDRTA